MSSRMKWESHFSFSHDAPLSLQNVLLFSDLDSLATHTETIMAHLCHLHIININVRTCTEAISHLLVGYFSSFED